MRLVTVVGARPQFIKAYALSRALRESGDFEEILVHTGQHFDPGMSEVFFAELEMPRPRYFLGIHGGSHGEMTGRMLQAIEAVLVAENVHALIVYGDTNSTLAGGLAASKLDVPVVHVEAGLRSHNRKMPEEINRVVVDHLSSVLLCPTSRAVENLKQEGIVRGVHRVGDLAFDAAAMASEIAKKKSSILQRLGLGFRNYGVATLHRAENVEDKSRLAELVAFLKTQAALRPLVIPLHPRTRAALDDAGIVLDDPSLRLVEPVGYLDMTQLLGSAEIVITDSGGLQREAYFHRVPCVTLREETEWWETIEHGWNRLWRVSEYEPRSDIAEYDTRGAGGRILDVLRSGVRT